MKVAVCIPSRGLIHAHTLEHVAKTMIENSSHSWTMHVTHDDPIPDAFNWVCESALYEAPDLIWIVEEDMGFGPLTFSNYLSLIDAGADVVASDYAVRPGVTAAKYRADDTLDYTGLGCTLMTTQALCGTLPFSSSYHYLKGSDEPLERSHSSDYGLHDVHFFKQLRRLGLKVEVGLDMAWQYRVVEFGRPNVNNGTHTIERLDEYTRAKL